MLKLKYELLGLQSYFEGWDVLILFSMDGDFGAADFFFGGNYWTSGLLACYIQAKPKIKKRIRNEKI